MRHSKRWLLSLLMVWCCQIAVAADQTPNDEGKEVRTKLLETVKVVFPKDGYSFSLDQVAKGVKIQYHVSIGKDFPGVIPIPFPPMILKK